MSDVNTNCKSLNSVQAQIITQVSVMSYAVITWWNDAASSYKRQHSIWALILGKCLTCRSEELFDHNSVLQVASKNVCSLHVRCVWYPSRDTSKMLSFFMFIIVMGDRHSGSRWSKQHSAHRSCLTESFLVYHFFMKPFAVIEALSKRLSYSAECKPRFIDLSLNDLGQDRVIKVQSCYTSHRMVEQRSW